MRTGLSEEMPVGTGWEMVPGVYLLSSPLMGWSAFTVLLMAAVMCVFQDWQSVSWSSAHGQSGFAASTEIWLAATASPTGTQQETTGRRFPATPTV